MYIWSETALKREHKDFEDGLNDARCHAVDPIAYQIHREYRKGVDIAQQLAGRFDAERREIPKRETG